MSIQIVSQTTFLKHLTPAVYFQKRPRLDSLQTGFFVFCQLYYTTHGRFSAYIFVCLRRNE